jgi:flagellar assembly protein FliH
MSSRVLRGVGPLPVQPTAWPIVGQVPGQGVSMATGMESAHGVVAESALQTEQRILEAHQAGLREGEASGRNRAAAELEPVLERLARSITDLAGLRPRLRREAEADLLRLALAIARRILRRELAIDPDAIHGLVLGALEKLQGQEIWKVRVHPSHAPLLGAALKQSRPGGQVEVIADPSTEPGAVLFETDRGSLDASTESQLQEIERGLADRLRKQA